MHLLAGADRAGEDARDGSVGKYAKFVLDTNVLLAHMGVSVTIGDYMKIEKRYNDDRSETVYIAVAWMVFAANLVFVLIEIVDKMMKLKK